MSRPYLSLSDVTFAWPDGDPVFDGLDAVFGTGRTGLVGSNGAGKSTLLRLIGGVLRPDRGSIALQGAIGYLRQDIALDPGRRVDDILGITPARTALRRIESGTATDQDFAAVSGGWDIEERAVAVLHRLGLGHVVGSVADLDRRVGTLSGGETVLLALTAELLREPAVLLLDEPTNNLDLRARELLYQAVAQFAGTLVVVSHDRALLDRMDMIAELRAGRRGGAELRMFGGNFTAYQAIIEKEREAARAAVRDAKSDVRRQSRELVEAQVKIDRRARYGKKMNAQKREPKIVMEARKRQAQESAGKLRGNHIAKVDDARATLAAAEEQLHADREVRIDLPGSRVYPGQRVVELAKVRLACDPPSSSRSVSLTISGPERIALVGANGIGKTTLLRAIAEAGPQVPWRYLPQRLDIFRPELSVVENVSLAAPDAPPGRIRAQLARLLFRGADADVAAGALSGGEQLRAALAMMVLAEPTPRLLMLDEPTNNLDLSALAALTQALAGYEGALVIASHDVPFLNDLGVTRWLELTAEGLRDCGVTP